MMSVLIRGSDEDTDTRRGNPWEDTEKMAVCRPWREGAGEANPASTLILGF